MPGMSEVARTFSDRFARRGRRSRRRGGPVLATIEPLESRLALWSGLPIQVLRGDNPANTHPNDNGLYIQYSQDPNVTADQHVVIDIDRVFATAGAPTTRVNVYCSTNPAANPTPVYGVSYDDIDYISVEVPNYDVPGTNNNSLTIKGIALPTDRIIISGSGRTSAGLWSDESGSELQIAFDIEGIDDTTVTAGGVINVSGAFTNDTGDASIHAIGEIAERSTNQQTGTIIVGETTPADPNTLPHPRLVSDFIEMIGAELDIYSDIVASSQAILRTAESAPGDSRSNLVLPYDITVTDPTNGVLELHSTRNITQLQSSTITAHKVVAVSNNSNPIPPGTGLDANAWNIDLGSVNNDFDEIALGMIAAPGDDPNVATQGRIGVRDIDDLAIADFGILASTGVVTVRTGGQLDVNAAIQATGLTLQSNYGIASSAAAIMKIGDLGITMDAANTADGATGDVTLNGRVTVGSGDFTKSPDTRIRSRGTTTIAGGILSPQKGTLLVEADEGILVDAPVQFGSTQLDVNSAVATVYDGDIRLVSNGVGSSGIIVRNKPGNDGVPQTLRASEGISLESTGDILIEGATLAGSQYGNPSNLTETAALPSITVKTPSSVSLSSTGSLQTVAYETNPGSTTNPLVGLISISGASQVTSAGRITADGAVNIDVVGDVSLAASTIARESVMVATTAGSIDVQGAVYSTGGTYTTAVVAGSQREPNVILSAPNGGIATSNLGTLRAGTAIANGVTTYGTVILTAQQDIQVAAAIDTDGGVAASTKLGAFNLDALLRTANGQAATISAARGVTELEFGRIVSGSFNVTNTTEGDITLLAVDNGIAVLSARNLAAGGLVDVQNNSALTTGTIAADGTITITNAAALTLGGTITSTSGAIVATSTADAINLSANMSAAADAISLTAHLGVLQTLNTGVTRVQLVNGGQAPAGAAPAVTVTIAAPAAGGTAATATAVLTQAAGGTWSISRIDITSAGSGYAINESPVVTIAGITGASAQAFARASDPAVVAGKNLTVAAGGDVTLLSTFASTTGDVSVSSTNGNLVLGADTFYAHALAGSVILDSDCGTVVVQKVCASTNSDSGLGGDVTITGEMGVTVEGTITADHDITVTAETGPATVTDLSAGNAITVTSQASAALNGDVVAAAGAVAVTSTSGAINVAANVHAVQGVIAFTAHQGVVQASSSGLTQINLLAGGLTASLIPPIVSVSIAAPAGGGTAATATAVLAQVAGSSNWTITNIVLVTPGNGYAVNETPAVTISGMPGAAATATGPTSYQNVVSGGNLSILAGSDVVLPNTWRSDSGAVAITSTGGGITSVGVIQATVGTVTLTSPCGVISVSTVCGHDDVTISAEHSVTIDKNVTSDIGDIGVSSDVGTLFLNGQLSATLGGVTLNAGQSVLQSAGTGVTSVKVLTGGAFIAAQPPTVAVNIAAPAGGGFAATASAIVSQIGSTATALGTTPIWGVTNIIITNPGTGYAVGESPLVTVSGINAVVAVATGPTGYQNIAAAGSVQVSAGDSIRLVSSLRSTAGDVTLAAITGGLDLTAFGFGLHAAGSVTLASKCAAIAARNICGGQDVDVAAETTVNLYDEVSSDDGSISVTSRSGTAFLSANMHADGGSITVDAHGGVAQSASSGLKGVKVVYGGQFVGAVPPAVTVTIAAPVAGGRAATGLAAVQQVGTDANGTPIYAVTAITLTDQGVGYALNEAPTVTVTGINGVTAVAIGPNGYQNIVAQTDVSVSGGDAVTLVNTVRAKTGDIAISSTAGNLDLGAATLLVVADAGNVNLSASRGAADVEQVHAGKNISVNAILTTNIVNLYAGNDATVASGGTVTLLGVIDSDTGDISITSRNRDLDFTAAGAQLYAANGGVSLAALNGTILSPPTLHAATNATLRSFNTLVLNNEITSDTGLIDLQSTSGSINLNANLDARDGSVRLTAKGSINQIGGGIGFISVLAGGSGYTSATTITIAAPSGGGVAARAMPIIGTVKGVSGVITGIRLTSPGSGYGAGEQPIVTINRGGAAPAGATAASAMAVAAPALGNSGLAAIDVLAGGNGYTATTTVTIAAPAGGGTAATAQAVIADVVVNGVTTTGVIVGIEIVDPGSGYGAGERPVVTIAGAGAGASATAIANITLQDIRAGSAIDMVAGTGVKLLNTIRAEQGHVAITSDTGNVNLAARTSLLSSFQDDITITARRGAIVAQRLAAGCDITLNAMMGVTLLNAVNSTGDFCTGDVSIKTINGNIAAVAPNGLISVQHGGVSLESVNGAVFVPQTFNVSGAISLKTGTNLSITSPLTAGGDLTLASTNGALNLAANVIAAGAINLGSKQGITQASGFIQGSSLVATNATTQPVTLTNRNNDVGSLSILSLGNVSYTDANEFTVPVAAVRTDPAVAGDSVVLSSVAPYSKIRIIGGLKYRTLSIGAANATGATVGTVEFVPTSSGDNAAAGAKFDGTLRDMIRYVNDNTAVYTLSQTVRSQPMAFVFDEAPVDTITLDGSLPLPMLYRPVTFDGGRLEASVLLAGQARLNVTQAAGPGLPYGLAFAPAVAAVPGIAPAYPGTAGSSIQHVAMFGFNAGSALVLGSGNNTVGDFYAGLRSDGSVASPNLVGLEVTGTVAMNNRIGTIVVNAATMNRFSNNTSAGILIRNGASGTRVVGNVIGDPNAGTLSANQALANGDGIRITGAIGTLVGSPDVTQIDLLPSVSNQIGGNLRGVALVNAVGTAAAQNVVRNNAISGNGVGVSISGSSFAMIGGADGRSANRIGLQTGDGVAIFNSTDVQVLGNAIGVSTGAAAGNRGNGISINGASQRVQIASGNRISTNGGNGVSIGTGATSVTVTGNTIGGLLDDGITSAGNTLDGVRIDSATGNVVGAGNTISYNGGNGVSLRDARAASLQAGNSVFGSMLTNNTGSGIFISGGSGTTVGGTSLRAANVIYGNTQHGIRLESSTKTLGPQAVVIQGNLIGTNANRDIDPGLGNGSAGVSIAGGVGVVVSNGNVVMNNATNGIEITDGSGAMIGGATTAVGNRISFNAAAGVSVGGTATASTVSGNEIANQGGAGVKVDVNTRGVRIGQTVTQQGVAGAGNVIRGNADFGVSIGANAQQIAVQGNTLYDNVGGAMAPLGSGANKVAPTTVQIDSAVMQTTSNGVRQLVVSGKLLGPFNPVTLTGIQAKQQYSVDLYADSASLTQSQARTQAQAQGRRFLGRFTVTATANGQVSFTNVVITTPVAVNEWITATATSLVFDPGSTSRSSVAVQAKLR